MAYEDLFNDTEVVPAGGDYWIRIKTTLTHDEKERADKHMHKVQANLDERGKMHGVVAPDYEAYRRTMVAGAIVAWNLDEADGTTWALSPDSARLRNIGRLPEHVFDALFARVEVMNQVDRKADRTFRPKSVSSNTVELAGTTESPAVLDRDELVDAVGDSG